MRTHNIYFYAEITKNIPQLLPNILLNCFKKCYPPAFKFYHGKVTNKNFPHVWCNINYMSVFTALNNTKRQIKFYITP